MIDSEIDFVPQYIHDEVDRLLLQDHPQVQHVAHERLASIASYYESRSAELNEYLFSVQETAPKKWWRYHLSTIASIVICRTLKVEPLITGMIFSQCIALGELGRRADINASRARIDTIGIMQSYLSFSADIKMNLTKEDI